MSSSEDSVGIRAWANALPGFTGILKQRYSDFMVNEIDASGQVVHLTNKSATQDKAQANWQPAASITNVVGNTNPASQAAPTTSKASNTQPDSQKVPAAAPAAAVPAASQPTHTLKQDSASPHDHNSQSNITSGAEPVKDSAQANGIDPGSIQKSAQPKANSPTEGSTNSSSQTGPCQGLAACQGQLEAFSTMCGVRNQQKLAGFMKLIFEYQKAVSKADANVPRCPSHILLDPITDKAQRTQCLGLLGSLMHCKPGVFATAGTKDKRAVTVQHVTAFKVAAERLAALNPKLYNFQVGNFEYTDQELHLGQLKGNQFQVILREVQGATREQMDAAAAALKQGGFINYYGLQRFGSGSVPTHRVGVAMLQGQHEEAVRLIMKPRDGEKEDTAQARRLYLETGDVKGALAQIQRHLTAERAILEGLNQHGKGNFLAALMRIPHGLRTMYVHAYQSYLWNAATSERCLKYGTDRVVQGDLVLLSGETNDAGSQDNGAASGERSSARLAAVHAVTEEEARSKAYSIEDVVMPLPGCQVQYPVYQMSDEASSTPGVPETIYDRLAAADNISLKSGNSSSSSSQAFSIQALTGDYRRIVHKPQDLLWKILEYADPDQPLALSELERLAGAQEPSALQEGTKGNLLALQLSFQLPPSCYATMLIRELTKMATGTAFHKSLTQVQCEGQLELNQTTLVQLYRQQYAQGAAVQAPPPCVSYSTMASFRGLTNSDR